MSQARRAEIKILYENKDISRDIAPYLLSFTFNDNSGDKSDDINISLSDRDSLWVADWFPSKGDKLRASIILHDWDKGGTTQTLPCGLFEIDEIKYQCPPRVIEIKGVSVKITSSINSEKHNKAWENIKLKTIAQDLAGKNGLSLFYDVPTDITFERREQSEQSDLEFLKNTCKDYGLSVKISDDKLIIYDEESYQERPSVSEIKSGDSHVISWNFSTKAAGIYKSARVRYHDAKKNQTFIAQEDDNNTEGTSRILEINERVENEADAKLLAHKRLKEANSREITGSITLFGDLRFLAGVNITVKDFGNFDGVYSVESVQHKLTEGYTTTLNLKMGDKSKAQAKSNKQKRQSKSSKKTAPAKPEEPRYYTGDKYYGKK